MWNMQNGHRHPKQSKTNFSWVCVYALLKKAFQKSLYIWGLKWSLLSINRCSDEDCGLINLPFRFGDLVLGYKGTDFPGFNVFHTRHLPTSPKYKLVSPVTDAEDWAFLKQAEVVQEKFENFLRNLEEGISQVLWQSYLLLKMNNHYSLL